MGDTLTEALNSTPGRLAEILLKKLTKGFGDKELPEDLLSRFDRLVEAPGKAGTLARVCLAEQLSYLFERAPTWTSKKLLPIFDWSSNDALAAWEARKYSPQVGSPELFRLTKSPFLELFGRSEVALDDLRTYAEWLVAILIANRPHDGGLYPLETTEARAALRRAGADVLSAVAHRLATEMEATTPAQGAKRWRTVVGPVFKGLWPLDIELQSNASNFAFVQILSATGDALPEAADAIIPFIRPDDPRRHTTIFSIAEAPNSFFETSPAKVLDLIAAIVGDAPPHSFFRLDQALSKLGSVAPDLGSSRKFQRLMT
jgi:hypothetical protein